MKLGFIPGKLFLEAAGAEHVVTQDGKEVFRSRSLKKAVTRYGTLRAELETQHPPTQADAEEGGGRLWKHIGEALVDDNHYRPQQEKTQGQLRQSRRFR